MLVYLPRSGHATLLRAVVSDVRVIRGGPDLHVAPVAGSDRLPAVREGSETCKTGVLRYAYPRSLAHLVPFGASLVYRMSADITDIQQVIGGC